MNSKNFALERDNEKMEINAELWAEVLLLAQKNGWVSNKPSYYYLASDLSWTSWPPATREVRRLYQFSYEIKNLLSIS